MTCFTLGGKLEIMEEVLEEMHSREAYLADTYSPYYVCSYGIHCFNLMNQQEKVYWESKRIPNKRLHILFVAPPGFMKSYYIESFGGESYSVFGGAGITMGFEQTMTESGLVGTIINTNGIGIPSEGAALTYQHGFLCIDEFSAITEARKAQYNNQMDTQLLAVLDHGRVRKRLGGGEIKYNTNVTVWGGVQPARYDLASGMGRRMCFLLFLPTSLDNDNLMETMQRTKNIRPDDKAMESLWGHVKNWSSSMYDIKRVEFDDSVGQLYKDLKLFSFESSYFDNLILGYHLAVNGVDRHIDVSVKDDNRLRKMIKDQKKWRDEIITGVDYIQLIRIIESIGMENKDGKIQCNRFEIINETIMIGWNMQQVNNLITEMAKSGLVSFKAKDIILEMSC
jgi:hypothetical protein